MASNHLSVISSILQTKTGLRVVTYFPNLPKESVKPGNKLITPKLNFIPYMFPLYIP